MVEYLSFQGGDLLPLATIYTTTAHSYPSPPHHGPQHLGDLDPLSDSGRCPPHWVLAAPSLLGI
jgi:hypothetical protein